MNYGYFDDAKREYVITNPRTPTKWINYLGTLAFGGFIDHTGGMLICKGDPGLNRILKYIPQLPASDFRGSTLYLRLKTGAGYTVFSPYFTPTLTPYTLYECHMGLGYTRIISEVQQVWTESTFFLPQGDERVIWDIKITNLSDAPLEIDAIPVVEYSHFDALKQFNNADWVPQTMQSRVSVHEGITVLRQYAFMFRDMRVNYLTSNLPVASFESDRKRFLGDNEYGSWASPLSLQAAELSNWEAHRGDNIGALMHHLGSFQSGETKRLIVQLGQAETVEKALPSIRAYLQPEAVDAAFEELTRFWDNYLDTLQVDTPDPSMNSMLNIHHPHQCHTTKNWSRYLSLYQLGMGTRGIGYRDSSQDVLGVLAHMPQESKILMQQLLSVQLSDGSAMHQFYPLTMEATRGDAAEMPHRPQFYSDDHLWIILAVCNYLAETGDFAFLEEVIPYYDGQPRVTGTVLDHMLRGTEFTREHVGKHGLPLLGFADWNDTMNLPAGAESLFTANLYGVALQYLIDLFEHQEQHDRAAHYQTYYAEMQERVNQHAWDGAWYVRYFTAEGQPIGSQHNTHGQIFINSQSWAVMSGFAPQERAALALDSVNKRLNTANGIKKMTPGYNGFDPTIGGASTFPPGAKENGGIFLHTNPWVIIAETMLGHGELAFRYYDQMNPAAKNDKMDEYEIEPYAYAQNILADEHPQAGLGRNSWLSGTAAWAYRAATQAILGIVPTYHGLSINPCIPQAWDGFTVKRKFRGATYVIKVQNPQHVNKGVVAITVDGQALEGSILPIFEAGSQHQVEVIMG